MTSELTATGVRIAGQPVDVAPHSCFACGSLNAHGLRLELHAADGACWTEVTIPERFQGWEGIAHGGILATILDEVMAWATIAEDNWGVTARMAIEYKRPATVGTLVRGEGEVVRVRRRLIETAGHLLDPATGETIATAEGLFVAAGEARKRELQERYGYAKEQAEEDERSADRHQRIHAPRLPVAGSIACTSPLTLVTIRRPPTSSAAPTTSLCASRQRTSPSPRIAHVSTSLCTITCPKRGEAISSTTGVPV